MTVAETQTDTAPAAAPIALGARQARPDQLVSGATGDWEVVIGLEVHAQVLSRSKLFSGAATAFGGDPNDHVSLVDAAMPGMLPVLNEECVRQAVRTGLGLKAKINLHSVFARKNYFYPDLPQGYQISQFDLPVVGEGVVRLDMEERHGGPPGGGTIEIGVERIHLEQDAGKSIHDQHPTMSFVDLNRSGVALMEIVSRPDIRSADEARAYLAKLRSLLRYLGTSDADMEKGNLRADINVSVRRPGGELGTRTETKNVNSMRFAAAAIDHEVERQIGILEDGGTIDQETRLFDPKTGTTRAMRSKEEAHDYRYFPDPDLLPLRIAPEFVEALKAELPELPDAKRDRLTADYGLTPYDADVIVADRETADFYEATVAKAGSENAKLAANWLTGDLFGALNKAGLDIGESPVSPDQLGGLLRLISGDVISGKIAKEVFEILLAEGGDPAEIVEARGLKQVTDTGAIEAAVDKVIADNPDKVEAVKAKPSMAGWFVGQVMKATGGKANPKAVNDLVKARLGVE